MEKEYYNISEESIVHDKFYWEEKEIVIIKFPDDLGRLKYSFATIKTENGERYLDALSDEEYIEVAEFYESIQKVLKWNGD